MVELRKHMAVTMGASTCVMAMNFFTGVSIQSVSVESADPGQSKFSGSDNKSMILKYTDGSVCAIDYFAMGSRDFPKEYMEVHFDEKTIILDDYKSLKGFGIGVKEISSATSEKGQREELEALYNALKGNGKWAIELWDLLQTTTISFLINN